MNKAIIIFFVTVLILLVTNVEGVEEGYHYQENGSVYSIQGSWDDENNLSDGNYSTYSDASGGSDFLYINYSTTARYGFIWQLKDGQNVIYNYTIPSACLANRVDGILQLQVEHEPSNINWRCIKSDGLEYSIRHYVGGAIVYEEGLYSIYATNVSDNGQNVEGNPININLTIRNLTSSDVTSAKIHYNNTIYSANQIDNVNNHVWYVTINAPILNEENATNITYFWNYTVNGNNRTSESYTHDIYKILLIDDDCSPNPSTAKETFNFTVRDEITDNTVSADVDLAFNVWHADNPSFQRYYNFSYNGITEEDFCIYPSGASYRSDISILYEATSYQDREWISESYSLTNVTSVETLYLLSTTNATTITIHVSDSDDNDLPNVLIKAYVYNQQTNNYSMVESEYTNTEGQAYFSLNLNSYYRFEFYQDNILKISTGKFKLTVTDLYYIITEETFTPIQQWMDINTIQSNISYDKTTKIAKFEWHDVSNISSNICFNITKANETSCAYCTCSTAIGGSISHTIGDLNVSYIGIGYATHNEGTTYPIETVHITKQLAYEIFGEESFGLAFILYLVSGLMGLANPIIGMVLLLSTTFIVAKFELLHMTTNVLMSIVFIGLIIIILMARKER